MTGDMSACGFVPRPLAVQTLLHVALRMLPVSNCSSSLAAVPCFNRLQYRTLGCLAGGLPLAKTGCSNHALFTYRLCLHRDHSP